MVKKMIIVLKPKENVHILTDKGEKCTIKVLPNGRFSANYEHKTHGFGHIKEVM